jgi:hypothetical protein
MPALPPAIINSTAFLGSMFSNLDEFYLNQEI